MTQTDTAQGVYYNREDYAGFFRRIIIMAIDICALFAVWQVLIWLTWRIHPDNLTYIRVYYLSPWVLGYIYLVLVKRSVGTLGYLFTGVRVVDIYGNRPSVFRMTGRFMWMFIIPLSFMLDILWLTGEETRQSLRDKTVGTYVIKKRAIPVGRGPVTIKVMSLIGLFIRVREVARGQEATHTTENS